MSNLSRRQFLAGVAASPMLRMIPFASSPFQLSIATDEITQDLGRALEIAAKEFGLGWVEFREIWKKNILRFDEKEIFETQRLVARYKVQVTSILSPLFKVDWPGAPLSKNSPPRDQFSADFTFEQQDEVLERSIALAKAFKTNHVRIFDFWRLDDPRPYRKAMDEKVRAAAEKAGKQGITLVLENEHACNTATAVESARILAAIPNKALALNWDPGNASFLGENAFPDGYAKLPKNRIAHVHCKNLVRKSDGTYEWSEMGKGLIDYVAQFKALKQDGYRGPVVLETHWRGAGTPEESSRVCWASMKQQLIEAGCYLGA
jgi:sugar phosphate isomerase/epimerase